MTLSLIKHDSIPDKDFTKCARNVLTPTTLQPIQAYSGQSWQKAILFAGVGFSEVQ